MLTPQQKAQAEKKLKNISEQLAHEEVIKSAIKKSSKTITEGLAKYAEDKKTQIELIRNLANTLLPDKILALDTAGKTLVALQEKLRTEREKCNKEALNMLNDKQQFEGGIEEIKRAILNIQKTIKESIDEETKKRTKIEEDLEVSLNEIRNKITEFETESINFDKENAELKEKLDGLKVKLESIDVTFKAKAEEKDEEVRKEREELTEKLKELEAEVEKATELNKVFSTLEKKNFDNKLSFYLKTKKFNEYSTSFESSAKTLGSCREELLKGVCRINIANETIDNSEKSITENNDLYLIELKRQTEKEARIEAIKKDKEVVRARIIDLQNKIKEKKTTKV